MYSQSLTTSGSIDHDTQVAARPPSRGGLAFDLVFGEQQVDLIYANSFSLKVYLWDLCSFNLQSRYYVNHDCTKFFFNLLIFLKLLHGVGHVKSTQLLFIFYFVLSISYISIFPFLIVYFQFYVSFLIFSVAQELQNRVERLKKRQKSKAPKLPKKTTKSQVQKKLIEADVRRQQQQVI